MTQYESIYISAARSGGSGTIFLCALLSIAQNPGSSNIRFSPRYYLLIFACILVFPLLAYYRVIKYGIGLKTKASQNKPSDNPNSASTELIAMNPLNSGKNEFKHEAKRASNPSDQEVSLFSSNENGKVSRNIDKNVNSEPNPAGKSGDISFIDSYFNSFIVYLAGFFPDYTSPWIIQALPYLMIVAWVNFNTWGWMTALLPFAMEYSAHNGSSSGNLAIAYQIGAFCLLMGDLSTAVFSLPIKKSLFIFTGFTFTVYTAALKASSFDTAAAAPILIVLFGIARFIEAHLITLTYRTIATQFAPEYREEASRVVGMCDQISTTIGAILSTIAVNV